MIEALTARDYANPSVRQLLVFLQNRVGELGDILRRLERESVRVHGVSVTDSVDFAVVRLVVGDCEAAYQILHDLELSVSVNEVLAVELDDEEGNGLLTLCRALIRGEVNIHYLYSMMTRPRGKSVMLVHVDDNITSVELLRTAGFQLIDRQDLAPDEDPEESRD